MDCLGFLLDILGEILLLLKCKNIVLPFTTTAVIFSYFYTSCHLLKLVTAKGQVVQTALQLNLDSPDFFCSPSFPILVFKNTASKSTVKKQVCFAFKEQKQRSHAS